MLSKALKMIQHAQPIIVVLENVKGFLSVNDGDDFGWLRGRLQAIGYPYCSYKVLSTHHFGLPQQRQRLFMVALREDNDGLDFRFPVGNESRTPSLSKFLKKRLAKLYANTIRCGGGGSKDRHAWDMVPRAGGGGGWYRLSVTDCKRLMGFPKDFSMPVPVTHQHRLLGNAITLEPARSIMRECGRLVHEAYKQSERVQI